MGRTSGTGLAASTLINKLRHSIVRVLLGGVALALVTLVGSPFKTYRGAVALVYLMIVAVVSLTGDLFSSAILAVAASLCLRFFFAPPPSSARIDEPLDIAAFVTLLATAAVITHLVSKMQQLTQELQRREAYLAEAQRIAHMGSWVWRVKEREALYMSEEWYRIYDFDPKDGLPAWEDRLQRIHPEDRPRWQGVLERATEDKSDYEIEFRILLPDGTVKHIHTVGHPVLNGSGELIQFLGSSTDITERKRSEEALRQAQADLARVSRANTMGELTASLAHEVNQPIAAAVTNANTCLRWLTRDEPDVEEARAAATRIVQDGTRAAQIISRVRLLFKKGAPQRELVEVNEVIQEMAMLLRSEAVQHNILVGTEMEADLPAVMGDRVQLQQVLMNLMMNAFDSMKDVNGTRELVIKSHRAENDQVLVSVSDTGVGLPPQQVGQIFDAFFTTKSHGTGMGLSISRSIVESHGGRLWAVDNSSRGASFCFTLPAKVEGKE
jgi:C4-dicarboxylate-specific signal transduction histidine kinase